MSDFVKFDLDESRFLTLLGKLIGEAKHLQNAPAQGFHPEENRASDHILEVLKPYTVENGGVLKVQRIEFVEKRGNVIIEYPGTEPNEILSFVGSHLDVVTADPNTWDRDPFSLSIDGDNLYGRGTTDCLGHVALLTDLMVNLAIQKPKLKHSIVVIFIANEENSTFVGVGIDQLAKEGYMDHLKNGPLFWVDAADCQPCIGTAGSVQWQIKVKGKPFHSGLPHKGINAIEFGMDAINFIQKKFYTEFPQDPREVDYNFVTQSTFKPTQISCIPGSLNQLPGGVMVEGDIRSSPFYDIKNLMTAIERYVAEINENPSMVENPEVRGPHSKYNLPEESRPGKLTLKWLTHADNGVACRLDSKGFKALVAATNDVLGFAKPYSIGGSLPLIRELQDQGFDVQISGYGISARYHADNECASLSSFKNATKILSKVS